MRKSLTVALVIGACAVAVPVSRTALAAYRATSCPSAWSDFRPPSSAPSAPAWTPGSWSPQSPPSSSPPAYQPAPAGSAPPSSSASAWVPAGAKLIFDDEFSKDSSLNSEWAPNWFGGAGPVNGMEEAAYSPSNVSISGGTLNLTLDHAPIDGKAFTGAIVNTRDSFTFTYGYVEWMAYLPAAADGEVADWPALWLDGTGQWPTTGEDDVLEGLHGFAAAHFESPAGNPGVRAGTDYSGWHTFGVDWQPGSTTYYYDGRSIGSITEGITGAPMYLIMDNTISASSPAALSYPAVVRIAWVRVWS